MRRYTVDHYAVVKREYGTNESSEEDTTVLNGVLMRRKWW